MMVLGPFAFAAPLALLGLVVLPIVWRLLRAAPPAPRRRAFAPWRLLEGLKAEEQTQERTPWWLAALRIVALALVCIGLARPIVNPAPPPAGDGPVLLVVDNDWAAARAWPRVVRDAEARLDAANREDRLVALVTTAPEPGDATAPRLALETARDAAQRLARVQPQPWAGDPAGLAERLRTARQSGVLPATMAPEWLSSGLAPPGTDAMMRELAAFGPGRITAPNPATAPIALGSPQPSADGLTVTLARADTDGERAGALVALDAQGRALGRGGFAFADGARAADAAIAMPLELRNQVSLVRVEGRAGAGGAQALDAAWRRPLVGLLAQNGGRDRQPLLADLHYIEKAFEPFAEVRRGDLEDLLEQNPGALVLTDEAFLSPPDIARIERFLGEGGLVVRFAGARLAARTDALAPVRLRVGGRAFGGALAWDDAQRLAAFTPDSPFFGLAIAEDITVTQQVLAEPAADLAEKTWARLADGTPLVTSERRGRGRLVLFHVTATPEWSGLPVSGLFVDMLRRVSAYAASAPPPTGSGEGDWRLERALVAEGRLAQPDAATNPVEDAAFDTPPGPLAPPGVWRRGAVERAHNLFDADPSLAPLPTPPAGLQVATDAGPAPRRLAGPLLLAGLVGLIIDALALLILAGGAARLRSRAPRAATGALVVLLTGTLCALALSSVPAAAQNPAPSSPQQEDTAFLLDALSDLRLAYVVTGDADVDAISEAGLRGLSAQLWSRTSIEPGEPIGVDITRDSLSALPLLYWPVLADAEPPAADAAAKVDAFLKGGGVIVFDTRDAGETFLPGQSSNAGLARLVDAIDVPPLQPVPVDHVMTKAFYLLSEFPGRWSDAPLWVEADGRGAARDGVSSVLVTSGDWAAAWAIDDQDRYMAAVDSGVPRQREMAYRVGINLAMYVLTGNYKADQVHVPLILERLGQ